VRLPETQTLPRTLSREQVAAVIDAQTRLRDRFLFAVLASTGMRIGQALGLRHSDIVAWERRIEIVARPGSRARARRKAGARGSVPVPGELIRLWSDYMHLEYGALDSDFLFVNLWDGVVGRQALARSPSTGAPVSWVGGCLHWTMSESAGAPRTPASRSRSRRAGVVARQTRWSSKAGTRRTGIRVLGSVSKASVPVFRAKRDPLRRSRGMPAGIGAGQATPS
jgi:integrase